MAEEGLKDTRQPTRLVPAISITQRPHLRPTDAPLNTTRELLTARFGCVPGATAAATGAGAAFATDLDWLLYQENDFHTGGHDVTDVSL
jgi:hypothetical protein